MNKRYIVNIDGNTTPLEDKKFSAFLKEKKVYWWHWLSNAWLIVDNSDSVNAKDLRDKIVEIYNGKRNLVLEIPDGGKCFGYGPHAPNRDMFKWIKEHWK